MEGAGLPPAPAVVQLSGTLCVTGLALLPAPPARPQLRPQPLSPAVSETAASLGSLLPAFLSSNFQGDCSPPLLSP